MIPILPIEVEERIIAHIGGDVGPDHETLAACALTCRAWVPRSRRYLFDRISIFDASRLSGLSSLHVSHPVSDSVHQLWGLEALDQTPFNHLIPHLLATRFPQIEHLQLGQRPSNCSSPFVSSPSAIPKERLFPYHQSLLAHLPHFRNISRFNLDHYHFASVSDVRRIVGTFPALSRLTLQDITWDPRTANPVSIYRATAWNLTDLFVVRCQDDSLGLWFWIIPPLRSQSRRRLPPCEPGSHLGLDPQEAFIMTELLKAIIWPAGAKVITGFQIVWKDKPKQDSCGWQLNFICATV